MRTEPPLDGTTDVPMSHKQEQAIKRLADRTGAHLTIDWQDMDSKQAAAMIWNLRSQPVRL